MYNEKKVYYIKALTPIHAGTGQGLETVDMPIQRERHTNIPKIESSSLKGSIKSWIKRKNEIKLKANDNEKIEEILGKDKNADSASRAVFTEARLLYFPVKSDEGVFKLVTCPYILNRWFEDISMPVCGFKADFNCKTFPLKDNCVGDDEYIGLVDGSKKIFLEEYIFNRACLKKIGNEINSEDSQDKLDFKKCIPLAEKFKDKIVIVNDSVFIDLVSMYTEIITRNRIGDNGTAEDTGLFTEEYLPSETIMYFTVLGAPSFINKSEKDVIKFIDKYLKNDIFQVGGDATIGKGFVKTIDWGACDE